MVQLRLEKRDWLCLGILVALSLVKLYRIDGGLVLGEPDEVIYNDLARNIAAGRGLQFSEGPYYYNLPLFSLLGSLLLRLVPEGFLALRLLSWFFSLVTTLAIYFYTREKFRDFGEVRDFRDVAFFAGLIFTLCPLAVFYSRLGLLEAAVTAFSFLFVALLDFASAKKSIKLSLLAGLFLVLAIGTKYSALMFVVAALILLTIRSIRLTRRSGGCKCFSLDLHALIPLLVAAILIVPWWIYFYRLDYYNFKVQSLVNIVGWSKMTAAKIWVGENVFTLSKLVWWLSWPVAVASLVGLVVLLKRWRQFEALLVTLGVVLFFIVTRKPFYPRYFFPVLPFLSIAAGVGLSTLSEFMADCIKRTHRFPVLMFRNIRALIVLIFLVGMVPLAWGALRATNHDLIGDAAHYIGGQAVQNNPYIFSNWWPNIVGQAVGAKHFSWLAESGEEIEAFLEDEERSALEILEQEGGWIVLEKEYSRRLISPSEDRATTVRFVQEKLEPVRIFEDGGSNFPYFRGGNRVAVYQF